MITFFLENYKGLKVLENILENYDKKIITSVIAARDLNTQKDYFDEIKQLSHQNEILFFEAGDKKIIKGDFSVAIGWRKIIKDYKNTIIIHDSLLPKYRGFAPLVNALISGDNIIGATAFYATENYDKGNIIAQEQLEIKYPIKIYDAIRLVTDLYILLVKKVFSGLKEGKLQGIVQDENLASYSLWRDESDYAIDWNLSNIQIQRFVDAVGYPYKGAFTMTDGKKIRVFDVEKVNDVKIQNRCPGKVIFIDQHKPVIVCGAGLLKIINAAYENGVYDFFPFKKIKTRFY